MAQLYRAAWVATQEDDSQHVFTGPEGTDVVEAMAERDEAAALSYVEAAWVETCYWQRVSDSTVPAPEGSGTR